MNALTAEEYANTAMAARSDSPTPSSVSTMSEWDDYNETLAQVLAWLLQAETQLKHQEPVSDNVDQVKEQFREHEEFMMILTSHQTSVGSVLEFGSQLINEGIVQGKEEREIREQMTVLSDRWENLRVAAMQRQSDLHQALMKLQQLQLQELGDWLAKAESKMNVAGAIGSDLDTVKRQVDMHKKFQEDLEHQQHHVNSLSHMVVVVDESESENATADLEKQLTLLGERWSVVCKWTEQRWTMLQNVLKSWQRYRSEEQRLSVWLSEKERALKEISVIDMGDKNEVQQQIENLKSLELELTQQQATFGDFNLAAQSVAQTLDEDSAAIQGIQETMEDFNRRWNTIASMLNTKMKHLKSVEGKLHLFLHELEENMAWISDTEMLLKPQANAQPELIESLDQMVKKRRTSILALTQTGEDLIGKTATAGQSVLGLEQTLSNFMGRWDALVRLLENRKVNAEISARRKFFMEEIQRILLMVTETTTFIEIMALEYKNKPKEHLEKLTAKMTEIQQHKTRVDCLLTDCKSLSDPALRSALEAELLSISHKMSGLSQLIKEKQLVVNDILQSTPPAEFAEKIALIQGVIDEVFPAVSAEFKYDDVEKMRSVAEGLKVKLKKLHEQEDHLTFVTKQQKDLLKSLAEDKMLKFQRQLSDLNRQWIDCKKITEARQQRVNEAITQTKELEIAMKETFNWMDDVDKFLEEITGTIAEGDPETIDSQVQEVEALQLDIATVQKKVDSLIETCNLIVGHAEAAFGSRLKAQLEKLTARWTGIKLATEQQKEHLRDAGVKFKEVAADIAELLLYLKGVEAQIYSETLHLMDPASLKMKLDEYQELFLQFEVKASELERHKQTLKHLISSTPASSEAPQILVDVENAIATFDSVRSKISDCIALVVKSNEHFNELEVLLTELYETFDQLDDEIACSSETLDGDDADLEKCLQEIDRLSKVLGTESEKKVVSVVLKISACGAGVSTAQSLMDDFKSKLLDTKERCKKVQFILEGELDKRRQFRTDLVQLEDWIRKCDAEVQNRLDSGAPDDSVFNKSIKDEISLNDALIVSVDRMITELQDSGSPERHSHLMKQLEEIRGKWDALIAKFACLQAQPVRELERRFIKLQGAVLSDIDNLGRRLKKARLDSPEPQDIRRQMQVMQTLFESCDNVLKDIEVLRSYATDLSKLSASDLDRQVKEVEDEYQQIKKALHGKEVLFNNALPLSESVFGNLDSLDDWLAELKKRASSISIEPMPETPKDSIDQVQAVFDEMTRKATDIEMLSGKCAALSKLSEDPSFRAMEARVHAIYETYLELRRIGQKKSDALQEWVRELDSFKDNVDSLNSWIDGRLGTLESIGGLSAKWDIEMELQKLKGLKSVVKAKECDMEALKCLGSEISIKGGRNIVDPFENQVCQRWDDMQHKIVLLEKSMCEKLKVIGTEESQPPEKRRVIEEEEKRPAVRITVSSHKKKVHIMEPETVTLVESALAAADESVIQPVTVVQEEAVPPAVEALVSDAGSPGSKILGQPTTKNAEKPENLSSTGAVDFQDLRGLQHMIIEIEEIETILYELKPSPGDVNRVQKDIEDLEERLSELHPKIERLISEPRDEPAVSSDRSSEETVRKLTRKLSGLHTGIALKKHSAKQIDYNFYRLQQDLSSVDDWLKKCEEAIQSKRAPQSLKEVERNFEKNAAEIEAVNARAEQLSRSCSSGVVPKSKIIDLNKRFKSIVSYVEKYQRPEEKVTNYKISVMTGDLPDSDTRANVSVKLFGEYGNSDQFNLRQSETRRKKFQPGQVDLFTFRDQPWLGRLTKLRVWHDNEGASPAWYLSSIYVLDELSERLYCYFIDSWLSKDKGAVLKEVPVSAMTLAKEVDKDILVKKHVVTDIRWLFDKLGPASKDRTVKPRHEFIQDIRAACERIADLEQCLKGVAAHDIAGLEDASDRLGKMGLELNNILILRERYVAICTPDEMHEIDLGLMSMRSHWDAVNREFRQLQSPVADPTVVADGLALEVDALLHWLSYAEEVLSDPSGQAHELIDYGELEEDLRANEARLKALNVDAAGSKALERKLDDVNIRFSVISGKISETKARAAHEDDDVKIFMEECDKVQHWLVQVEDLISEQNPHPVDEDALEEYSEKLHVAEGEFSLKQEALFNLKNLSKQLLSRGDISNESRRLVKLNFEKLQEKWHGVSIGLGNRRPSVDSKLARATRFLEELEELSIWMAVTRDLLEGQASGKPGFNVDPDTIKQALETRTSNVESINSLLRDLKKEGELASGRFPSDVSEKIARLNSDWQVIIRLASQLREQPVTEEVVVAEVLKGDESVGAIDFEPPFDDFERIGSLKEEYKLSVSANYSSTNAFDENVAQLHDWLKLIETKLKVMTVVVGDVDDMDSALQKQATIQLEMEEQKNFLEYTLQMGASLSMSSSSDSAKYSIDDKISKLNEHWDVVCAKVASNGQQLEELLDDWRRFSGLRVQLESWMRKTELLFDEERAVGKTVNELEVQLSDHKRFLEELSVWQSTFAALQQITHAMSQMHSAHQLNAVKNIAQSLSARWDKLKLRSNSRQQSLQEALDRLLQFHKNMISALTWLSSAESKVAELDSLVEASQAEETSDVEELHREMLALDEEISNHQPMFRTLNDTGTQIMFDLEPGEVRTALQSKLDDMNDRWSSLGIRVNDIRDKMSNGVGEWRQLQLDMQEIIDWLVRADQELQSQKPIGADIQTVQTQHSSHQLFKGKLNVRRVVIEQAIDHGRTFLATHDNRLLDLSRTKTADRALVVPAAEGLQKQIAHVQAQWNQLMKKSDDWQKTLDLVLDLLHQLVNQINDLDARLTEAERLRNQWLPVEQINASAVADHVEEVTLFNKTVNGYEALLDSMDGSANELRHRHGVALSAVTETTLQRVSDRWKRLRLDANVRLRALEGQPGRPTFPGSGSGGSPVLQGSVELPWERGAALNKVPYYINHNTKATQWDHPKMTDLYHTLGELNDVKFAAYRTAMKLRCIQKAICLDMVDLKDVLVNAFKADRALANNDQLVGIDEMITVLAEIFDSIDPKRKEVINIPQSVDMTLNWLLNVFDSGRIGKIRVLSFKVGVVLLSRARVEEKYAYLFSEATSGSGLMNSKKLGLLLHDAVQIPRQLGEIAAFGGSNIEPSVRSCFEKAKSPQQIDSAQFIEWTSAEPQSLVWVPVLHRLAAAETAKHEAKCNICKEYPIIGFRYRCLKCFNYDLCQSCFWSGRVSKTHRITHPMHQYSLATTTGEDLSDFVKLMKNKFKSRKYRSRPPKKLGYLPVQTIMEGSSIETPTVPATPDMSFSFSSFDSPPSSPSKFRFDVVNEEHRLIQQMIQNLNGDANGSVPQSPSQILARLDSDQKQDINDAIRELEDEHKSLEAEYTRLKTIRPPSREASSGTHARGSDMAGEAEIVAEAKILKQHKGRLEARMQILEDHNRQLEAQLQRLRQLLEQPPGERDRGAFTMNVGGPPSPTRLGLSLAGDASHGGEPTPRAYRGAPFVNGYSSQAER